MHTKETALADPVIGKGVRMILDIGAADGYVWGHLCQKFGDDAFRLFDDAISAATQDKLVKRARNFNAWVRIECELFLPEYALFYLLAYPDTACMLDLSRDTLMSMAKMGSVPAALYMLIVEE